MGRRGVRSWVRIPVRTRDLSFPFRPERGFILPAVRWVPVGSSSGVKRTVRDVDIPPVSSSEHKIDWCCISRPSVCANGQHI